MTSRQFRSFNVYVTGALPSRCPIASIIAFRIHTKGLSKTPSLDELEPIFRLWDTDRHTSPLGDYLRIDDWFVTCTRRDWTVWSREAFAQVMPLPLSPAVSAKLAA